MIVGVCSDKGSPGATTLAVALGLVWPGDRAVVECDPSGGALTFRMRHGLSGEMLYPEPTIASMAAVVRMGISGDGIRRFCQPTSLGVPVIPGPLTAQKWVPVRGLWPQIAQELQGWSGTAIADLGRMQPGNAALPIAQAATAVLLVGRADTEGLYGLRERAASLAHVLGDPNRDRPSVAVVVTGPPSSRHQATKAVKEMLASAGSPVPVAGFFAHDPAGAARFWAGEVTKKVAKSELIQSAQALTETVFGWWPELAPAEPDSGDPELDLPVGAGVTGAAATADEGMHR